MSSFAFSGTIIKARLPLTLSLIFLLQYFPRILLRLPFVSSISVFYNIYIFLLTFEATPRLTAEVSFYFDVVYDDIVKDSSTKEQLEDVIEKKVAEVMKVHVSMILNVTVSKGSIRVNFIILSPDDSK